MPMDGLTDEEKMWLMPKIRWLAKDSFHPSIVFTTLPPTPLRRIKNFC